MNFNVEGEHVTGHRYITHLYCLAVQAGFYSDAVKCWIFVRGGEGGSWVRSSARSGPKIFSSPVITEHYDAILENMTVIFLSFRTDRPGQTVQRQIRLLLEEQSDEGLHCLQFPLHFLDALL